MHASLLQTACDIPDGGDVLIAPLDHVPDCVVAVHCLIEVVIKILCVALMIEQRLRHGWTVSVAGVVFVFLRRRTQVVRGVFGAKHGVYKPRRHLLQQRSNYRSHNAAHTINSLTHIIQSLQRGCNIQTLLKLVMYVSHDMSESH